MDILKMSNSENFTKFQILFFAHFLFPFAKGDYYNIFY